MTNQPQSMQNDWQYLHAACVLTQQRQSLLPCVRHRCGEVTKPANFSDVRCTKPTPSSQLLSLEHRGRLVLHALRLRSAGATAGRLSWPCQPHTSSTFRCWMIALPAASCASHGSGRAAHPDTSTSLRSGKDAPIQGTAAFKLGWNVGSRRALMPCQVLVRSREYRALQAVQARTSVQTSGSWHSTATWDVARENAQLAELVCVWPVHKHKPC